MRAINVPKVCKKGLFNFKCRALAIMPEAEHYLFVAYAGVEVLHIPATFWWVNVGLLITGGGAVVYRLVSSGEVE